MSHPRAAEIAPLPPAIARPFWSVMIPTFNRTEFLERTLQSVLAQDPGPAHMQIEVVENGLPTDAVRLLVERVGGGRVSLHQNNSTLPLDESWNTCIRRSRGRWVHLLHDDDAVLAGFYQSYEALIAAVPGATLVTSPCILIDHADRRIGADTPIVERDGPASDFMRMLAVSNPLKTPSVVISRAAYEKVGGYSSAVTHTADWEMFFRAAEAGIAVASREPRSLYRVHAGSDTSRLVRQGKNIEEIVRVIDMCFARLPQPDQRDLRAHRYAWASAVAYGGAIALRDQQDWDAMLEQARWAWRLQRRPRFALTLLQARLRVALS